MQIHLNPINNLNITIKIDKIDGNYYGEVLEVLKVNESDFKISYQ